MTAPSIAFQWTTGPEVDEVLAREWLVTNGLGGYLDRYLFHAQDDGLLKDLFPILSEIIDRHLRGTRFGIGVDPKDGLLRQGAEGYQLTWMDAKVDDWVVTPRRGKAVEINALWFNALQLTADLRARDAAYHQGTVWPWLLGHFVDAWLKTYPGTRPARPLLEGLERHLQSAGVGQVSEIFDAAEPYRPRGCIAQAWSVAELLRAWLKTERA